MQKNLWVLFSTLLIAALLLSACNADGFDRDSEIPQLYLTATADAAGGQIPQTGLDTDDDPWGAGDTWGDEDDDAWDDGDKDRGEGEEGRGDDDDDEARSDDDDSWVDDDDRDDDDRELYAGGIPVTGERFENDDRNLLALSELDGTPVYNRGGNRIGEVVGMVTDDSLTRVLYLVIEREGGGVFNRGERLAAVPLGAFAFAEETRVIPKRSSDKANPSERGRERGKGHQEQVVTGTVLVFEPDEARLSDAPRYAGRGDWRSYRGRMDPVRDYWRDDAGRIPVGDVDEVRWLDFDRLEGFRVVDRDGDAIGEAEDWVIDFNSGELRYLLVDVDGEGLFDGGDDAYLLIPAGDVALERTGDDDDDYRFVYSGDRDDLRGAQWVEDRSDLYWD